MSAAEDAEYLAMVEGQRARALAEVERLKATLERRTNIATHLEQLVAHHAATIRELADTCCEHGNMCDIGAGTQS